MNDFDNQSCPTIQCLVNNGVQFGDQDQIQLSGFSLINDCKCQPTVITTNIIKSIDENGEATIQPIDIDGGSFDNCGI